ncbi:hypothetical protein [Flavobacterium sp. 140616W15]|uniref:hypothetical protein n=1 Tax=Flavobacterium sp. 140616W15 TaxID=2478552 RepID=UPI000F0CBB5F|nr:hypothetical protein [Flavobacterium sp. 140616W15]AYN04405.1 hypothetical protein EAG11_09595 [Flavobacterium sp. 140616W15]
MGLDIVIYKENNQKKITEIKEKTHKVIFSTQNDLSEMTQLIRLKDYYKTNVHLELEEVKVLIDDLKKISKQIESFHKNEIINIINLLSEPMLKKVHIAGD